MNPPNENPIEERHWKTIEDLRDVESDALWEAVFALRSAGAESTFQKAVGWCSDPDPFHRSIGVSILAQFGPDTKAYREQSCAVIRSMVATEEDQEVISSLISAVHFRELHDELAWLVSLADHPSEDIRWRVAWALPIPNSVAVSSLSIETLVKLMNDSESRVRDWATFSIAILDDDTPTIRAALLERISDPDFDTRSEAAIGLARRKEQAGIAPLIGHLRSDHVGELFVEAAELYGDARLRPALQALKRWWDVDPELLDRAIAACS